MCRDVCLLHPCFCYAVGVLSSLARISNKEVEVKPKRAFLRKCVHFHFGLVYLLDFTDMSFQVGVHFPSYLLCV